MILKDKKNIGRVFSAKLQPRSSLGTFVRDGNAIRRSVTSSLKRMPDFANKTVGYGAKIGGKVMTGLSFYSEGNDYYNTHHYNLGRSISYGTTAGLAGLGAGTLIATAPISLPTGVAIVGAVAISTATSAGVKWAYNNVKFVRDGVNGVGDWINKVGTSVRKAVTN